jgi:hypothetical protein
VRTLMLLLVVARAVGAPPLRNTDPKVEYTGSKACAACHRSIYESYVRTGMGRSLSIPSLTLPDESVRLRNETLNREFRVFREGGFLYQSESEHQGTNTVFETAHKLEFAIGSGENGISFAVRRGDHLFQAPLSWYAATKTWDFSPGFRETGEGFGRPVYEACVVCHSGRVQAVPGREGQYRDPPFAELAIGCENCHGPGQLHVAERGRRASGAKAASGNSIVNPARLPPRLAEDICMRCHQGGDARVLLPDKNYGDFRPGTPLLETLAIFSLPAKESNADLLQHHASMKLSRCYRATNGRLSCLTCHNPHEQPAGAQQVATYFNAKCSGCHTLRSCKLNLAARRQTSPPDNCVACHMPKRSVATVSHSALTNHRIPARPGLNTVPGADTTPGLPGLLLVNAREDQPALPLLTRLAAYGELMGRAPALQATYFDLLNQALQAAPEDPLVLAARGRKALQEGNPDAIGLLSRAEAKGSAPVATYLDLSDALSQAGRVADAVSALERGEKTYPFSQILRKHLVLGYIRQKEYAKAKMAMERYVAEFPEDAFMRGLLQRARAPGP